MLQLIRTTYWTRFNQQIREDEKIDTDDSLDEVGEKMLANGQVLLKV